MQRQINYSTGNRRNASRGAASFCSLTNCILCVVISWLLFLYYCHEIDHKTVTEELAADLAALQKLEADAEASLKMLSNAAHSIKGRSQEDLAIDMEERLMKEHEHDHQRHEEAQLRQHLEKEDGQPVEESTQLSETDGKDAPIHVVFSTDCSFYQDWQTLLIFYSAELVHQPGAITRIASGCDDEKKQQLVELYRILHPQYGVHFTPDFKTDGKTKKKYDFYNKPYGVHHWLLNAEPAVAAGTVVIVIDPDMIFLRPITGRIAGNNNNLFLQHVFAESTPVRVERGVPTAQLYGLGAPWTNDHSKNFNRTAICGEGSPCLKVSRRYGEIHFSVGPPYMLERDDLLKLTTVWTEMVPRVYSKYPQLLAEMYAYSMAAAHTELPHLTLINLMVSNTNVQEEGWAFIDALGDDVCEPPEKGVYYPHLPMPNVLHFCQFFRAGEIGFQKRRVRKQIFDCDMPMMKDLPRNLGTVKYKNRDGEILPLPRTQARRNAFMLCVIHQSINGMLNNYKDKMCAGAPFINRNTTVNVVSEKYWS